MCNTIVGLAGPSCHFVIYYWPPRVPLFSSSFSPPPRPSLLLSVWQMAGSLRGKPLPDQALEDLLGMTFPLTHPADTNSSSPTAMQWQACVSTEARFKEEDARDVQAGFISAGNDIAETLPLHPFDSAEKGQMGDDMGEDEGLLPGQSYKTAREIILSLKTYQIMSE